MGQALSSIDSARMDFLARSVDDVRAAFAPSLDDALDVAWRSEERQVASDALLGFASKAKFFAALEFAVRRNVSLEALQHATIGSLCPSASEMVLSSFGGAPSLAYVEMDCRRTLLTDFDARGDAAADADAAAAALEFFVECEIDHFGDENHCRAFALELAAAYARARRRAAARAGLGDDAATLRPISAASYAAMAYPAPRAPPKPQFCRPCTTPRSASAASLPRTCSSSSLPADGGYAEEKRGDP